MGERSSESFWMFDEKINSLTNIYSYIFPFVFLINSVFTCRNDDQDERRNKKKMDYFSDQNKAFTVLFLFSLCLSYLKKYFLFFNFKYFKIKFTRRPF